MNVAIVGGGLMGVTLGYYLSTRGVKVDIFEASSILGGLAGPVVLDDGTPVDRFYHAILPGDDCLSALCQRLGIQDQLRFRQTKNAFHIRGATYSMNSTAEFLRFQPLSLVERFRLAATIARAQLVRDWRDLEDISVEQWLRRWSGGGTFEKLWRPLLAAKFDGQYQRVPATWMWSRLTRMKSMRSGANQRETAGHLIGGYATLLAAMAESIRKAGGRIHLSCAVREIIVERQRAVGVRLAHGLWEGGPIVATMQAPILGRLLGGASQSYRDSLAAVTYLGIVCPLVVLDRPASGYWTLNIADTRVPFTGVIETTAYIDPKYVGGHHLVYLPKYTAPGSGWQRLSDGDVAEHALTALKHVFPDFDRRAVRQVLVHRERYVEPIPDVERRAIPAVDTPIRGLFLASTAQIYPALSSGEAVTRHAKAVAESILRHPHVPAESTAPPHATALAR